MAAFELRNEVLDSQQRAQHIGVEDLAVVIDGGVLDGAKDTDAGVVDERVCPRPDG
jgi:hypothetical protein